MKVHPLAIGSYGISYGKLNLMMLDGKVNALSKSEAHESVYNIKLTTTLGFNLTVGYSRFDDPAGNTHSRMGGFRGALYRTVAAGVGCQFFAEPCWLQSSFPPLAGQGVDAAAAAGIDTATAAATASGADIGVEFVCTAAAGSDTLFPAVGGFGSTDDADPECSITTLELGGCTLENGGWKRSTKAAAKA